MKSIYLVDVSSIFFRAFYAIRSLSNPAGMPTNAIYGVLSMTMKLMREVKPDYMAFCFDLPDPSFRKEIDARYKANRSEMPEELAPQIPYIKKLATALGIPCFEKPGFEADDLIGTITTWGRSKNLEVVIVSGDKDFGQLIHNFVSLYDTMKEVRYDAQGVVEKWGIEPKKFIDYLALVGDTSDNIAGVAGIGPKGAQKLLTQFDSLEDIYANLDKIDSKSIRAKLEASRDEAFLSQKLVRIVTDVPLDLSLDSVSLRAIDRDRLRDLLTELDFKVFLKNLLGDQPGNTPESPASVSASPLIPAPVVQTEGSASAPVVVSEAVGEFKVITADVSALARELKADAETWGLQTDRGVFLSQGEKIWIAQGEPRILGEMLTTKNLRWKGSDLKLFFKNLHVADANVLWDQLLAGYVVRAGIVDEVSALFSFYGVGLPELPSPEQTLQAHIRLERELTAKLKDLRSESVLHEMELPLIPILVKMETAGIKIDRALLKLESDKMAMEIRGLDSEIQKLAGTPFNVASTKQLGQILFEKLKLPPGKKTKTGFSTDNEVLEKLGHDYPIAGLVVQYRELSKLKSTYVDALPALADGNGDRVHTTFNQSHTATGRLSSVNPNLQNIPIRTERGRHIRKAFIAEKNHCLFSSDYSQIELRIMAHISGDEGLIRAFEKDLDIHTATAAEVFGVGLDAVNADMRRKAKAVNFGLAYGQGVQGLSESLKIPRKEATEIIASYFKKFPKVKNYMQSTVETAQSQGFVETIFGRRRYLDELKAKSPIVRKFGERAAINAPMQGSVSDLVKKAMIAVDRNTDIRKANARMLLQVHDELLFEVRTDAADDFGKKVKAQMESVVQLRVPIRADIGHGPNWDDMK